MKTAEDFYNRYGKDLSGIIFRSGAPFTSQFGLDNTFSELRLHMGVDRAPGSIYAPFDGIITFEPDSPERFGNLLTLETEYGFIVRIGHMEKLSDIMLAMDGDYVKAGTYLGEAGRAGKCFGKDGRHTHTEIVSCGRSSMVLDEILRNSGADIGMPYTTADVVDYCHANKIHTENIPADPIAAFIQQKKVRNITHINKYICDRIDYLTGEPRRFYSSYHLFTM